MQKEEYKHVHVLYSQSEEVDIFVLVIRNQSEINNEMN